MESGGIPVDWDIEKFNVDAGVNGGVFLCMRPGFYHFSAALSANASNKQVAVYINHNSVNKVYARYTINLMLRVTQSIYN